MLLDHTDLSGLCCHQGHDDVWSWVAAKGHVWICGPAATGSILMFMTHVAMGVIGTKNVEFQELCKAGPGIAGPALHWPWDCWPCPLLSLGLLALSVTEYCSSRAGPPQSEKMTPHLRHAPHLDNTLAI